MVLCLVLRSVLHSVSFLSLQVFSALGGSHSVDLIPSTTYESKERKYDTNRNHVKEDLHA